MADLREELVIVLKAKEEIGPQVKKARKAIENFERKSVRSFDKVKKAGKAMASGIAKVGTAHLTPDELRAAVASA